MQHRILLARARPVSTPALFLDRDGVLIEDRHHLSDPRGVALCAGAEELIRAAGELQYPVVVITNQSGIARGLFPWAAYERVTDRMLQLLGPSAPIAAIYANGYAPSASESSWRKPSPLMLQAAAADLNLNLKRSLLIGDRLSDLMAGARAGLPWLVHVLTGHGERECSAIDQWRCKTSGYSFTRLQSLETFPLHRLACL